MDSDCSTSRHTNRDQNVGSQPEESHTTTKQEEERRTRPLLAPDIPNPDLSVDFTSITDPAPVEDEKIQKRKSNLLKLNEENEKLQRELQAMSERLEAAERKRAQLQAKEQKMAE